MSVLICTNNVFRTVIQGPKIYDLCTWEVALQKPTNLKKKKLMMALLVSDMSCAWPAQYYSFPSRILKGDMDLSASLQAFFCEHAGRL